MFSSRKKDREKDKDGDASSICSNDDSGFDVRNLNDRELDGLFKRRMADMNIKGQIADKMLRDFDREKKIQLCQQQKVRSETPKTTPAHYCHQMKKALNSREDDHQKDLLVSLRVSLGVQEVPWIDEFGREGGFELLVCIMDKLITRTDKLRKSHHSEIDIEEDELVNCLQETLKCTRGIMNTWPGVRFLLKKNSKLCFKLIEALYVLNSLKKTEKHPAAIVNILGLLAALSFLGKNQSSEYEITGNALFVQELSNVAEKRKVSRFKCIVDCFNYKNPEIMYKALVVINTLLSCIDDGEWQMRMLWRSDFMNAGLKNFIPYIEAAAKKYENIQRAYTSFEEEKHADIDDLLVRFEKLRGDADDPVDCFNMLYAACKQTECEDLIYDVMLRLMLITGEGKCECCGLFKTKQAPLPPSASSSASIPPPPPPPPPPLLGLKVGPPAPPQLRAGGPPPAPPPPPPGFIGGKAAAIPSAPVGPGPPPPPPPPSSSSSMLSQAVAVPEFLRKKSNRVANVPMKKITWNSAIIKPSSLNKDSLWAELNEEEVASEEVYDILKKKFFTSNKANNVLVTDKKSAATQLKTKKPLVIQDGKILQALSIFQGSCKLKFSEWQTALLEIDEGVLDAGLIGQLRNVLPPLDILKKLKELAVEEFANMVEGEQFVATIAAIDALPIRLESIQLKLCWADNISELQTSITTVTEACEEVRRSQGLKAFINLVLLAGNFMGRTKNSNDTFAFELGVLNKLVDTKDSENSETLLHNLIILLEKNTNGKYNNFAVVDFQHVIKAFRIDLSELSKTKDTLKNSLKKISMNLETYKKQGENDHYLEKIGPFVESAKLELDYADDLWNNMQLKWSLLQKYLCFDPKKYPMERLFEDLKIFTEQYDATWRDIVKSRERETTLKKKRQPLKPFQNDNRPASIIMDLNQDDNGVIDQIEQMLEKGNYRLGAHRTPNFRARATPRPVSRNEENVDQNQMGSYRIRRKQQPTILVQTQHQHQNGNFVVPELPKSVKAQQGGVSSGGGGVGGMGVTPESLRNVLNSVSKLANNNKSKQQQQQQQQQQPHNNKLPPSTEDLLKQLRGL